MAKFKKQDAVSWPWLGRQIQGKVLESFESKITKQIKGKNITRNGSKENPAYLVISEAGNEALKLESELQALKKDSVKKKKPKMFS